MHLYLHRFFLIFVLVNVLTVSPAFAYLDPGSGSYFTQLLIAGLAGSAYVVKLYYGRIKLFLKDKLGGRKKTGSDDTGL